MLDFGIPLGQKMPLPPERREISSKLARRGRQRPRRNGGDVPVVDAPAVAAASQPCATRLPTRGPRRLLANRCVRSGASRRSSPYPFCDRRDARTLCRASSLASPRNHGRCRPLLRFPVALSATAREIHSRGPSPEHHAHPTRTRPYPRLVPFRGRCLRRRADHRWQQPGNLRGQHPEDEARPERGRLRGVRRRPVEPDPHRVSAGKGAGRPSRSCCSLRMR